MNLVDVEYTFDRAKVIFYFTADGRVDFAKTADDIKAIFKSKLNVTPNVAVVSLNTLPRSEKKTQRVFDHRGD